MSSESKSGVNVRTAYEIEPGDCQKVKLRSKHSVPICVDLDGTLLLTDTLVELLLKLIRLRPHYLLRLIFWAVRGKAYLKRSVSCAVDAEVVGLPIRLELLRFLDEQRARGHQLILVTGADRKIAVKAASWFGMFQAVLASDGITNLTGQAKANRLLNEFGPKGFIYVGDSKTDLKVWRHSRAAVVIGGRKLVKRVEKLVPVLESFPPQRLEITSLIAEARIYQWVKNFLIFVPLVGAHEITAIGPLWKAIIAFFSFGLCASGGYILNDLLDLENDRRHPVKMKRPLAAGRITPKAGILFCIILTTSGLVIGWILSRDFLGLVLLYLATTVAYSLYLKRIPLLDVFVLAGLYTLRMFSGEMATGIQVSEWLLMLSMFTFLSLALVKRFSELKLDEARESNHSGARGYLGTDASTLLAFGLAADCLAALVLALYIHGGAVTALYSNPRILWLTCPLLLFWLSRIWFLANRGLVDCDPIVFAFRDRTSYAVGLGLVFIMLLAS